MLAVLSYLEMRPMSPDDPLRLPSVELTGGLGRLHCSCGHSIPTDQLHEPIECPRCGRVWQLRAEVRLESYDPQGQSLPPE